MTLRSLFTLTLLACFCFGCEERPSEEARTRGKAAASAPTRRKAYQPIKLVLWITIDQLRGDTFLRSRQSLDKGGLWRLLDTGLWFSSASHRHALTETAPGHATLFTGASPREHGLIANEWLDAGGRPVLAVADPGSPLLGPALTSDEVHAAAGRSPVNLRVSTFGDVLLQVSGGRSKVVAVSMKDRGAIPAAGLGGKAFWLGRRGFVTSRYYFEATPAVLALHHASHPPESYLASGTFLHEPPADIDPVEWLRSTPQGDVATIDLAERLLVSEELGKDDAPDLLSVSLSATDYVGHAYGPESLEAKDNLARLDRLLGQFLTRIDAALGPGVTLVVLSSDHGVAETPETQRTAGLPTARFSESELEQAARRALKAQFAWCDCFLGVSAPSVYLDRAKMKLRGLDIERVRAGLARALSEHPLVYQAYALGDSGHRNDIGWRVALSEFEGRSGDVYVVLEPYVQFSERTRGAEHGSPWGYDAHVPIVLSGPGIPTGVVHRPVDTRSLAGTVAALLGVPPPAAASPNYLGEALPAGFWSD